MSNTKHRFELEALRKREAGLAWRGDAFRTVWRITGIMTAAGFVLATIASRDLVTALVAASPFAVTVAAMGWEVVTRAELRKVRLLVTVLERRRVPAPPGSGAAPQPEGSRSRVARGAVVQAARGGTS